MHKHDSTSKHTCVYGLGPFKQEYILAANRIRRQIRVQLHYFFISWRHSYPQATSSEIYQVSMYNAQN